MSQLTKIKTAISLHKDLFIFKKMPTIVYASGRVGSISIIYALKAVKIFSIKVEWLDKETGGSVRFCKKHIIKKNRPAKIITLVRDPVEILASLFFSKAARGHLPLGSAALKEENLYKLFLSFEKEILDSDYFTNHLYWFEQELEPHLDINVFSKSFSTEHKYSIIDNKKYPMLILRTDLLDETKETQIKKFLDIDNFTIKRLNVKAERKNGALYKSFMNKLTIPKKKLETIYHSNYAQHFFSQDEIKTRIEKYSK